MPKLFHCDLELGLSNAIIKVIPNIKVKFCLWHLYRALEINKNKYCNSADLDDNVNLLFKCITNLAFVDPQYTIKLYDVIFRKNTNENFKKFLKYFKDTYIIKYNHNTWNYFANIENTTNNCCESYNNKINNYFNKKPTFFKLLYVLRKEEDDISKEYLRLTTGIWYTKRKIIYGRSDEKDIIVRYYEDVINDLKTNNANDDEIVNQWFKCLIRLSGR